jgi:hypothetical protein
MVVPPFARAYASNHGSRSSKLSRARPTTLATKQNTGDAGTINRNFLYTLFLFKGERGRRRTRAA